MGSHPGVPQGAQQGTAAGREADLLRNQEAVKRQLQRERETMGRLREELAQTAKAKEEKLRKAKELEKEKEREKEDREKKERKERDERKEDKKKESKGSGAPAGAALL